MKGNFSGVELGLVSVAQKLTEALRHVLVMQRFSNGQSFSLSEARETALADVVKDLFPTPAVEAGVPRPRDEECSAVYRELRALSTLVDFIPDLRVLSAKIGIEQTGALRMSRREALEGLSELDVAREFVWRINELVCGVYGLFPRKFGH